MDCTRRTYSDNLGYTVTCFCSTFIELYAVPFFQLVSSWWENAKFNISQRTCPVIHQEREEKKPQTSILVELVIKTIDPSCRSIRKIGSRRRSCEGNASAAVEEGGFAALMAKLEMVRKDNRAYQWQNEHSSEHSSRSECYRAAFQPYA